MLTINSLQKSFGGRPVLKDVSFKAEKGETIFILGVSGTGKSVLLKILVGLLPADAGEVFLDNQSILGRTEREFFNIRRRVGMVFQQPALFDAHTVEENIVFGLRRAQLSQEELRKKAEKCLSMVGLGNILDMYPHEISYGMQKRVSLARTLALEPEILLYDEPTTGLDPISTSAINALIKDLSRSLRTTSIVVSHDMNSALNIGDRIIVLDQGMVVAEGDPTSILKSTHPLVRDFMAEVVE